ncbi:MAG: hypothetical protein QMC79_08215 [Anaerosomatales bacterium]|nr:hypothetical protein [Anaerosomatales bacterium]
MDTGAAGADGPVVAALPRETVEWLTADDNPAAAVLARRELLGEADSPELQALWARRNEYPPVAAILGAMSGDGSWTTPGQDYKKYQGSLWQVHFLGELYADGEDERARRAADYAFSRQLPDGSWSATNAKPGGSIACLTANVGRALARLGHARDERVLAALRYLVDLYGELGTVDCRAGRVYTLNGYCHMLTPKELLFLAEIPAGLWPEGAGELRDACVAALRDKQVLRCMPAESREFNDILWSLPSGQRDGVRERFLAEHPELHYKEKAGWKRFGYPLSYNSDALEALWALAAVGEERRPEYETALALVRESADEQGRWALRNTFNGKMLADVEVKGEPSKWVTLRALRTLKAFGVTA